MKSKLFYVLTILLIGTLAVIVFVDREAVAQTMINIKLLTPWAPGEVPHMDLFQKPFVERMNKRGAGRVNIIWRGPEAVPPFEQLEALRKRVFDLHYGANSYELGEVPGAAAEEMFSASPGERRKTEWYDLMKMMYMKRAGVVYLVGTLGPKCITVLKKPVTKVEDFKGMKMRVSPIMDPFFTAMGAKVVVVKPAEIYSALERGVVDGAGWGGLVLPKRFNEVAKYIMQPYIMGPAANNLKANQDSWNSLPQDVQKLIMDVALELQDESWVSLAKAREDEIKDLVAKYSMQICTLLPEETKKAQRMHDEIAWRVNVLTREPEFGPRLKAIADPYLTK